MEWLDLLEAAVEESEKAFADRVTARSRAVEHVARGKDAEEDWLDLVTRLVKTTELRAPEKEAENEVLLAPLNHAIAHLKTVTAARATRRKKARAGAEAPATGG